MAPAVGRFCPGSARERRFWAELVPHSPPCLALLPGTRSPCGLWPQTFPNGNFRHLVPFHSSEEQDRDSLRSRMGTAGAPIGGLLPPRTPPAEGDQQHTPVCSNLDLWNLALAFFLLCLWVDQLTHGNWTDPVSSRLSTRSPCHRCGDK